MSRGRLVLRVVWPERQMAARSRQGTIGRCGAGFQQRLQHHASCRAPNLAPVAASDYAPDAQYYIGRCLEAKGRDEAAFKAYQNIIEKYPRSSRYKDVHLAAVRDRQPVPRRRMVPALGYIPFTSMDQTAQMFGKIVNNGPYSDVAPHAQLRIGAAREKQKNYPDAVKAYATAATVPRPATIASDSFPEGIAYADRRRRRIRSKPRHAGHRVVHRFHHTLPG